MSPFVVALLSLIPSIGICVFVFFRDRKEKEPFWLLALIFGASAAVAVPAAFLSDWICDLFGRAFKGHYAISDAGMLTWADAGSCAAHHALCALIGIALIEELARWLVLFLLTRRSRHFNCTFDGLVYSVVAAMGAAVARCVRLALTEGPETLLLRSVETVPWYLFFGIVMGVFYTLWNAKRHADRRENSLIASGRLKEDKIRYPWGFLLLSIAAPVFAHGLFSFVFLYRSQKLNLLFYVSAAVLAVICVLVIDLLSRRDKPVEEAAVDIIEEEHHTDIDGDGLISGKTPAGPEEDATGGFDPDGRGGDGQ